MEPSGYSHDNQRRITPFRRRVRHPGIRLDVVIVVVVVVVVVVAIPIILAAIVVDAIGIAPSSFVIVDDGGGITRHRLLLPPRSIVNRVHRRRRRHHHHHRPDDDGFSVVRHRIAMIHDLASSSSVDDDVPPTPTPPTMTSKSTSTSTNTTSTNAHRRVVVRAGFVGCGTIAMSIVRGLANVDHAPYLADNGLVLSSISVTRRSTSKSSILINDYPDVVTAYDTSTEVVSNSDLVFLCVLPHQVDDVLMELVEGGAWRREDHTLVSLSTSRVKDLIVKTGLRRDSVYKMICLPLISRRGGCALLQPPPSPSHSTNDYPDYDDIEGHDVENGNNTNNINVIKSVLNALGGYVECRDDDIMDVMMITTCMMGPMYGIMRTNRDWLVSRGVSPMDASYFVGRSYLSMVQDAVVDCDINPRRFDDLIEEQTPGGLNEQALGNLHVQGTFDSYNRTMDAIFSRLRGESDGTLPP
ncbi:hypothetical protein ACHAXA_011022 [Cyclostephanos tholiformis]|uniref:Pyrroline-5-carboxylate reductase catalytic N-terminal domain-containing protein n=1 Tax=Cyclostephanos tholiformis TaxID=382380 RepID=A0ABD3RZ01_9STRA